MAINLDALPPVTAEEGFQAAQELVALLEGACGGQTRIERLDAGRTGMTC